jgi:oligoribonuclease (3'-5' exoribonuclease)
MFNYAEWCAERGLTFRQSALLQEAKYVFLDMETTGLDANRDIPMELAAIVTDGFGNVLNTGAPFQQYYWSTPTHTLDRLDPIVRSMHKQSGLFEDWQEWASRESADGCDEDQVFARWIIEQTHLQIKLNVAGANPGFDISFLKEYYPSSYANLDYHPIDVRTLRFAAQNVNPRIAENEPRGANNHRALDDVVDAIHQWQYYLDNFLFVTESDPAGAIRGTEGKL